MLSMYKESTSQWLFSDSLIRISDACSAATKMSEEMIDALNSTALILMPCKVSARCCNDPVTGLWIKRHSGPSEIQAEKTGGSMAYSRKQMETELALHALCPVADTLFERYHHAVKWFRHDTSVH